jgi:CheY-like chemotaxis protein
MNRKNILIVDDEQDVLLVLEKGLIAEGYSVITASNGNDAIGLAKSRRPDLIILDVLMQDVDGPEVKRKLKEDPETKDIPLIFLTGMFPKREDDQDGRIVAGHVLFEKPYDILELVFAIEQLLREKVSSEL